MALEEGDICMVCSDGITDALDDGELSALLSQSKAPEALCSGIIAAALGKQCRDNITTLILRKEVVGGNGTPQHRVE